MKPFDIELAKAGHPVCTREGQKVRIICFDRKLFYQRVSYPILALIERSDGEEDVSGYSEEGKVLLGDGAENIDDLMMLPEKKEGWAIICKSELYESEEIALKDAELFQDYIKTIKIEWEE